MSVAAVIRNRDKGVVTVDAKATLVGAIALLERNDIGAVVVTDSVGRVRGIFSERDFVRAVAHHGAEALSRSVGQFMTTAVVTCCLNDSVDTIMRMMTSGNFRHVPVLHEQELIGIVSIRDVVSYRMAQAEAEVKAMREYIVRG